MRCLAWILILTLAWSALLKAEPPDERVLWQLFHAQKYRLLRQAIAEYQKQYPNWQPPAELMRWLSAVRKRAPAPRQAAFEAALRRGDYTQLRKLARRYPQALSCQTADVLLAVAAAFAQGGDEEAALAKYQKALSCPNFLAKDVLDQALWQLTPKAFAKLLDLAKGRLSAFAYEEFAYQNARRQIFSDLRRPQAHLKVDAKLLRQAVAHHDLDAILAISWALHRQGDFAQARTWFAAGLELVPYHEGLASGLLQSLIQLKQEQAVLEVGERYPKLRPQVGSYLLERAWEHYRQGDYSLSQKLAEQVVRWLPEVEEANYLLGWLAFKREDYKQAQRIFQALCSAHPEREDYAHALVISALQAGEDPDRLAERFPEVAVQQELIPYRARRAYQRKQFLRAYLIDPQNFAEYNRLATPDWGMGAMARFKSGQAGLDRLHMAVAPWYGGSYPFPPGRFDLNLGRIELSSNRLKSSGIRALRASKHPLNEVQRIALAQEQAQLQHTPPPHTAEAAWLELTYQHEGELNPYLQLGLTPVGAELSPRPTARLGISDWLDGAGWQWRWQAEAYRQPIRQSLLSYTGWEFFGKRWGRVLRNGAKFSGLGLIGPLALYQAIESAFIDGQSTQDNWMVGYTLAAGYNLPWPRFFDYFSFGPYFHFIHYANNQSHFRPGHGGYFSPQAFYAGGVQLALRTEEGKRFLLESRLALGIQHFREEAAPWFPRGCVSSPLCDLKFPKNRETSFAPAGELRFVFQLHPHLQLVGGVYARQTQGWREAGGGLLVRVLFAPGSSVLSSDLPEALFAAIE
jgi:Tfp pilus assembly protein PilF